MHANALTFVGQGGITTRIFASALALLPQFSIKMLIL
jgi:hypothetical protein